MLSYFSQSNRRLSFQARSLDIAAEFAALVRDATCDVLPSSNVLGAPQVDPGLLVTGWQSAAVPGSSIALVGDIDGTPARRSPPLRLSYQVVQEAQGVRVLGPPALDIMLRIREITGDPVKDNPIVTTGYWIREFPLKKVCNQRLDPSGRGEFY
jgi:hypothetical protein